MDIYWITWFPGVLLASFGVLTLFWRGIRALVRIQEAVPLIEGMHDQVDQIDQRLVRIEDRLDRKE